MLPFPFGKYRETRYRSISMDSLHPPIRPELDRKKERKNKQTKRADADADAEAEADDEDKDTEAEEDEDEAPTKTKKNHGHSIIDVFFAYRRYSLCAGLLLWCCVVDRQTW